MNANVCVVFVKSELLPDAASNVVMPLHIGEVRHHFSVQACCIETAMLYFYICQSPGFQEINEFGV